MFWKNAIKVRTASAPVQIDMRRRRRRSRMEWGAAPPESPNLQFSKISAPKSITGTCKSIRQPLESPPIVSDFTLSRIELPGGVAQLACRVRGVPTPKTKWFKIEEDESLSTIDGQPNYMVSDYYRVGR